jgi:fructuronate reductase
MPVRTTPAPPVRIVHLGLGAFSRSHVAWYTAHAADAAEWGIAAYTGRSRGLAECLTAQNGLYTLVERDAEGDRFEIVSSIVRAHPGDDFGRLLKDLASPDTAVVTLTITEAGYRLDSRGLPDIGDPEVDADLLILADIASGASDLTAARPQTALVRLLLGLEERRRRGSGPMALLSSDNLPDNGGRLRRGTLALAESLSPELANWIDQWISFPSSSVDRITPRITNAEIGRLGEMLGDDAPVVAEPFSDWVIEGAFPAGRPQWETAGARFVDDLAPWEARKLWMLNGAHTLLACIGLSRGHRTVAEAIDDPICRQLVERLWDEDAEALPPGLGLTSYRSALLHRFTNGRIEHRLEQIASDSFLKLQLRVVPVAELLLHRGERPRACAAVLAAWLCASRRGLLPSDEAAPQGELDVDGLLAALGGTCASSTVFADDVRAAMEQLEN